MFEIVAVGAMAMQFELRIPNSFICSRTGAQSSLPPNLTVIFSPRSFSKRSIVSCGKILRSHFEPLYDSYAPFSFANNEEVKIAL